MELIIDSDIISQMVKQENPDILISEEELKYILDNRINFLFKNSKNMYLNLLLPNIGVITLSVSKIYLKNREIKAGRYKKFISLKKECENFILNAKKKKKNEIKN